MQTDEQVQALHDRAKRLMANRPTGPEWGGAYMTLMAADIDALLDERAALKAVVEVAEKFIEDSEPSMAPPAEACNACYWNLRGTVRAYQARGERDASQ